MHLPGTIYYSNTFIELLTITLYFPLFSWKTGLVYHDTDLSVLV